MNRNFFPSSAFLLVPVLLCGACALAEAPGEISSMSTTMTGMAGDVEAMNASLGVTNSSLGTTNAGLDAMDARLAAMLQQLQAVRGSLEGMQNSLGMLDVMVGQMEDVRNSSEGLGNAMNTTNSLLGEVLVGINATSSGMQGMGGQLNTMLGTLAATNAGLDRMSEQLDTLGPSLIEDVMPQVEKGVQSLSVWLLPIVGALAFAWFAVVALLWRIGSRQKTAHVATAAPAKRSTEALLDASAGAR
ncbi:MAG: hypothetical protein O3A20_05670 [Planctomycetota bacterium]|nr:hypothetical protein [Planctomycetota bacterium]